MKWECIKGEKINYLTSILELPRRYKGDTKNKVRYFLCKCDCGKDVEIQAWRFKNGEQKSCGCKTNRTHKRSPYGRKGNNKSPLADTKSDIMRVWGGMLRRCYSKKHPNYRNYGGRGVGICKEWRNNPKLFVNWAFENGYKKGLEIDRIDVNAKYSPDNCRFVTHQENNQNKRDNVLTPDIIEDIKYIHALFPQLTWKDFENAFGINSTTLLYASNEKTWGNIK